MSFWNNNKIDFVEDMDAITRHINGSNFDLYEAYDPMELQEMKKDAKETGRKVLCWDNVVIIYD